MKKFLSVILCMVMLATAVPFSAYAQEQEQAEHSHSLVDEKSSDESKNYTYCDSEASQDEAAVVDEKNAYATVNVSRELYPESAHPYANYTKQNYAFEYPSAVSLSITFSDKTQTEDTYDLINIYDGDNRVIGRYSGKQLAGKTINISGNFFRIRFWTDHSKTFYGFSIDNIEAKVTLNSFDNDEDRQECRSSSLYPFTDHNYPNSTDQTCFYTNAEASSLELYFSDKTKTEKDYDFITIYDGSGNEVGKYSGDELAGAKINVDGPSFSVRFTSDHSQSFYGYSLYSITANIEHKVQDDFSYPASPHPYENNMNDTQSYTYPDENAKALAVTFSDSCRTEEKYDVVSIYDASSKLVGSYSGRELAGRTIIVDGNCFSVKLKSDRSQNYFGYAVTKVTPITDDESVYPESAHPYANNEKSEYVYSSPDKTASALRVKFSSRCLTEAKYDTVEIFDGNGEAVGVYSGSQLANKVITIQGNSFRIKLNTDHSQVFYGFKVVSVVPVGGELTQSQQLAFPESNHPYEHCANQIYRYKSPNPLCRSLKVKFSSKTQTEKDYDIITIYDSNGEKVGSYSGTQLAGKTVDIDDNEFSIVFTTDHSSAFYGFRIDSIQSVLSTDYYEETENAHSYALVKDENAGLYRNGVKTYVCRNCGDTYTEEEPSYVFDGELKYSLSYYSTVYNGAKHNPILTITKRDGTVLKNGVDYDLHYSGDGVSVGRYYASITLKNGYVGKKSIEFTVKPKGVSSFSLSQQLGGFNVTWDKQTDNTSGYEIQYSQNSNFSSAKTVNETKNSYYTQKVTGLSRNKKYYVRIRTYKFASDGMKIYSDYTSAKSVVTGDCLSLNERAAEVAFNNPNVRQEVFGYSYQGRPLEAYIITPKNGKYNKTYYLNFAIHGFEGESYRDGKYLVAEGNRVVEYYASHLSEIKNMRLIIIPCLNPDGVIAGTNELYTGSSAFGRNAANHVDLNRDFNTFNGYESRAMRSLMSKYRPNILCDFHGWLNTSIGNPNMVNIFSDTLGLSRKQPNQYGDRYGYLMGYSYKTYGAASLLVEYRNSNINHTNTVKAISKTIAYYN